ncbi:uncharacterized protein LOC132195913 isoform X2 [Neocloeon triangulifer]|uniref:uncharacterized protein LOC132195913 isoform X2 n=1 Tax=Neocloeon triangulifer TaxID=2078957 RepID=UPI00286F63B6|nr:uncharacterized protein LOC132195913 isoform X2 [Neocloeon triangulifer]
MTLSETLNKALIEGHENGSPDGAAKLGFFKNDDGRENAENVFVLVAHYDFKDGEDDWPRTGNDKDVANLRKTFAVNRNCRFRDLPSPKKEDLLALLADGQLLKKFFASEEPSVFIFIILSHGGSEGKIYTDENIGPGPKDYDSFNTKQLFGKLEKTFANSLRLIFLGPCRGGLDIGDSNPTENQDTTKNYSSKVSFEPKMHNTVIFYSTVETTNAGRDKDKGTWLVQCLCEQLNLMRENESIAHFSTGIQNRTHKWATKLTFINGKQMEQTMETKMFPHDRIFKFSVMENCCKAAIFRSGQVQSTIEFDWMNPHSKSIFRGKLAAIFHQGNETEELEFILSENLGFETKKIKLDSQVVKKYFQELTEKSWIEYGCFAAFFFAQVTENKENQVCVNLSGNEQKPIGELIHSLLGSESKEWRGKPKLFFLIDVGTAAGDAAGTLSNQPKIKFRKATPHSGWMIFILRNKDLLPKLLEVLVSMEIKGERSLQECLDDLLVQSNEDRKEIIPQTMLVSTLPYSLHFARTFVKPNFRIKVDDSFDRVYLEKLIEEAMEVEKNPIWLLSSLSGSGKTTVMSEIALELQRRLCRVKVFKISLLQDVLSLLPNKKVSPSLVTVISSATRVDEKEIEFLIMEKKIILMFDGFDEICPFRRDAVLNLLQKAVEREIPIWISTRPQEEVAIRTKLGDWQKICEARILPLDAENQTDLLKMTSKRDADECKRLIKNFENNGSDDVMSNPLHLTMIAQLEESFLGNDSQNLFNIYEKIVKKKISEMLAVDYIYGSRRYEMEFEYCEKELQTISLSYLNNKSVKDLKYPRNGIVTLIDGNIVFVHQTFAEFLAAQNYIECLKEEILNNDGMPLDLLEQKYRQVRKFVEMKISKLRDEETPILNSLFKVLSENITRETIFEIFISENLSTMFSLFENQISFSNNGSKLKFHFENSYQILKEACWNSEKIALKLLNLGAFESFEFSKIKEITKILSGAIQKNFELLFSALVKKCSTNSLIQKCRADDNKMSHAVKKASRKNHHKMLGLVIESGLIELRGRVGREALQTAEKFNSVECVQLLFQHGVASAF